MAMKTIQTPLAPIKSPSQTPGAAAARAGRRRMASPVPQLMGRAAASMASAASSAAGAATSAVISVVAHTNTPNKALRKNSDSAPPMGRIASTKSTSGDIPMGRIDSLQTKLRLRREKDTDRNVALIRLIYTDARRRHRDRQSYQARIDHCNLSDEHLYGTLLREVFYDVTAAVRRCWRAQHTLHHIGGSPEELVAKRVLSANVRQHVHKVRPKVLAVGALCALLRDVRSAQRQSDSMWHNLRDFATVSLSLSLGRVRKTGSCGLRSWKMGGRPRPLSLDGEGTGSGSLKGSWKLSGLGSQKLSGSIASALRAVRRVRSVAKSGRRPAESSQKSAKSVRKNCAARLPSLDRRCVTGPKRRID